MEQITKTKEIVIHVYTICWNESKFLHYFLNYYLNIVKVNHVFVYDNQSTDYSQDIVKSYKNTTLIEYDTNNQIRDDIYLQIKNNEWKKHSQNKNVDFVFIVDVDEILHHPSGLRNHLQTLYNVHKQLHNTIDIAIPTGYQMYADNFRQTFTYDPLEISYEGKPDIDFNKYAIFNPDKISEINYFAGCHKCDPILTSGSSNMLHDTGIKLLHYKFVYGIDYLIERYELYQKRLSDINKVHGWGRHYLQKIDEIKKQYINAGQDIIPII